MSESDVIAELKRANMMLRSKIVELESRIEELEESIMEREDY